VHEADDSSSRLRIAVQNGRRYNAGTEVAFA
jgi:hypothetical protein